jgi:hypothetical protein
MKKSACGTEFDHTTPEEYEGRAVSGQIVETSSQAIDNSPQYISRPGLTFPTRRL